MNKVRSADEIRKDWDTNPRWKNVKRDYSAEEVVKLSGSVKIEYSLANQGAEKLWNSINNEDFVSFRPNPYSSKILVKVKIILPSPFVS